MYVVHTIFLVNQKNYMCTYDIYIFNFVKVTHSFGIFFFVKVQKNMQFAKKIFSTKMASEVK